MIFEQNLDIIHIFPKNPGHNRHFSEETGHYHIWSYKTGHFQISAKTWTVQEKTGRLVTLVILYWIRRTN